MSKEKIGWNIVFKNFQNLPLKKKKVMFESFVGRGYNDNPYAISEHLSDKELEYDLVWGLDEKLIKKVDYADIRTAKRFSVRYLYHLATAKYIITNSRLPKGFVKREGQVIIQTWHGTPLKKLVLDMENNHFPNISKIDYLIEFLSDVKKWDYLVSPNQYSTNIFRRCFAYEGEILEVGYPRNDRLVNFHPNEVVKIKEHLKIPETKKVLLYTPTFRENKVTEKGKYVEEQKLNLAQIVKQNPDWIILVRSHYLINKYGRFKHPNIIDVSQYQDLNDLFIISDCLLTDYSSTMFDYTILNRPIIKYAYDLAEYSEELRGFYLDYHNDIPATSIENERELGELLDNFEQYQEFWLKEINDFNQRFNYLADGKATKRLVEQTLLKKEKN